MNLKHIVRDAAYLCLGTAAVIVEKGGDVAKTLIRKGAKTWDENQDTVNDLKDKAKDLYAKAREKMEAAAQQPDPAEPDSISRTDEPVPPCPDEDTLEIPDEEVPTAAADFDPPMPTYTPAAEAPAAPLNDPAEEVAAPDASDADEPADEIPNTPPDAPAKDAPIPDDPLVPHDED